jgi:flagellin
LISEIDRVASQTQFNGQNLIDGSYNNRVFQIGANSGQTISFSINAATSSVMGAIAETTSTAVTTNNLVFGELIINGVDVPNSSATNDTVSPVSFASASAIAKAAAINSVSSQTNVTATVDPTVVNGGAVTTGTMAAGDLIINGVSVSGVTTTAADGTGSLRNAINAVFSSTGVMASMNGTNLELTAADGRNIEIGGASPGAVVPGLTAGTTTGTVSLESDDPISVTGTAPANAGFTTGVIPVNTAVNVGATTLTTQTSASSAIDVFDTALRQVANVRADLGAILNRLDSTVNNLGITSENLEAARSQIMDADFAAETASFSRNQILQQASTAMLAQANVSGQIALQLLGG